MLTVVQIEPTGPVGSGRIYDETPRNPGLNGKLDKPLWDPPR